ncbi:MAG: sulfite exporter TauE/SafE family protein [Pseudomonadota bacterium]
MTLADSALLLTAFATGLLGSTHCVGMCGGISAALSFALPPEARRGWRLFAFQLAYNSGRILTYTLLGVAVGALAHGVLGGWAQSPWPRVAAGLFMIALGLYLAGWWLGLQKLERVGGSLWKVLEPLRKVVFPVNRYWKALLAGGLWGFLPCGLVYSALALALARADAAMSGAVMLAFGLGTLPVLLLTGAFAGQVRSLMQKAGTRRLAGALVILFGLWTAGQPLLMNHDGHGGHSTAAPGAHAGHDMRATTAPMAAPAPAGEGATDHAGMAPPAGMSPTMEAGTPATAPVVPDTHADHHEHMPAPAASPGAAVPGPDTGTPEPMPAMDHSQHPH